MHVYFVLWSYIVYRLNTPPELHTDLSEHMKHTHKLCSKKLDQRYIFKQLCPTLPPCAILKSLFTAIFLSLIVAYVPMLSCLPKGPSHGLCVFILRSGARRRPVAPVAPVCPVAPVVLTQCRLIDVSPVDWIQLFIEYATNAAQ